MKYVVNKSKKLIIPIISRKNEKVEEATKRIIKKFGGSVVDSLDIARATLKTSTPTKGPAKNSPSGGSKKEKSSGGSNIGTPKPVGFIVTAQGSLVSILPRVGESKDSARKRVLQKWPGMVYGSIEEAKAAIKKKKTQTGVKS